MSDAPNFQSILDEEPTEVKAPPPLPEGTYLAIVGQHEMGKSSKKKTPFVQFALRPIEAMEDVDTEILEEIGGLEGKNLTSTYYLTEDAAFMLDQFHEHCGLDLSAPASRRVRNEEVCNAEVLVVVKHELTEDGKRTFARVQRTAPVSN